jgi:hypothetical protein
MESNLNIKLLKQIARKPIIIGNDDGINELNVWELKAAIIRTYNQNNLQIPQIIMCVPKSHASAQGSFTHIDDKKQIPKTMRFELNDQTSEILKNYLESLAEEEKTLLIQDVYFYEGRPGDLGYIIQNDNNFKDIKEVGMVISGPNNQQNHSDNLKLAGTVGIQNIIGLNKYSILTKFKDSIQISLSNLIGYGLNSKNNVAKLSDKNIKNFDNHCINSILYTKNKANQYPDESKNTIFNFNFDPLGNDNNIKIVEAKTNLNYTEYTNHISFLKPIQHQIIFKYSVSHYPDNEELRNKIINNESKQTLEDLISEKLDVHYDTELNNEKNNTNQKKNTLLLILSYLWEILSFMPKKIIEFFSCFKEGDKALLL